MPKKKEVIPTPTMLGVELDNYYVRWKHIYDNGCSDPTWEDGVNINLARNHILWGKHRCEEVLKENYFLYPDSYFFPEPIELPNDFMACDRKLGCRGKVFKKTKTLPYSEVVKFDWKEAFGV